MTAGTAILLVDEEQIKFIPIIDLTIRSGSTCRKKRSKMEVPVFNPAPLQSAELAALNIAPPAALTDQQLLNPVVKRQRFNNGRRYRKRLAAESVSLEDNLEAERYQITAGVAMAMPAIQRNIAPVGAQAVADILMPLINARLDATDARLHATDARLHARFEQTDARIQNAQAKRLTDRLTSFKVLPIVPPAGQPMLPAPPVPAIFPQTRRDLFNLTVEECNALFQYYRIDVPANNVLVEDRRNRLALHLGVPRYI